MINLAGVVECDQAITVELIRAGITPVTLPVELSKPHEVPYSVVGLLGGELLIEQMNRYPEDSIIRSTLGVDYIRSHHQAPFVFTRGWYYWRVSGFIPLPIAEILYEDPVGRKDVRVAGHCGCPPPRDWTKIAGQLVVDSYHIDSQAGLDLFAQTIRDHDLI